MSAFTLPDPATLIQLLYGDRPEFAASVYSSSVGVPFTDEERLRAWVGLLGTLHGLALTDPTAREAIVIVRAQLAADAPPMTPEALATLTLARMRKHFGI